MTETFVEQMNKEMEQLGITLNGKQMEQFFFYYEILVEKNKVMNLTTITEECEVVTKHFSDSVSLLKCFVNEPGFLEKKIEIMDVGTGAGFPGIPLKIVYPDLRVTLLDSLNKRVIFLQEACAALGLDGMECVHGRAEDMGHQEQYREKYDLCVSRAVANLASLTEYCMPFVKVGGWFVTFFH